MGTAAAAWDVLAKAANLAQMVAMLVTVFTSLLRVQQSNKRECAKLERCVRRLRALLQWPATCPAGTALLLCSEVLGDSFGKALGDAAGLVDSYKKSTLWRRVRSGGRMAAQLRDMQDIIDSYSGLLLFVNAHFMLQQHHQAVHLHRHHPIPSSPDTSTTIPTANDDDTSQSPCAQEVKSRPAVAGTRGTERANDACQGGIDTDPAGCESNVSALLPIVISHP